ncbi:hypothetical protein DPMN_117046 [Dreissena polymorpha]|uniref:Uncharacterized protein n=1 Tax=Dreissena polymorpha TaxID=45954 RepID=A0A9D4QTY5_DREPO|nr:hypothetical protein DPMN_117046 [Dreissena polymorpha]
MKELIDWRERKLQVSQRTSSYHSSAEIIGVDNKAMVEVSGQNKMVSEEEQEGDHQNKCHPQRLCPPVSTAINVDTLQGNAQTSLCSSQRVGEEHIRY